MRLSRSLVLAAAFGAVAMSAAPAMAAGDAVPRAGRAGAAATAGAGTAFGPWRPLKNDAFTANACNTRVHVTFPVSQEETRTRLDSGGNHVQEVRGRLVVEFTKVGSNRHFVFDVSGESRGAFASVAYRNGDFLYAARGSNYFGFNPKEQRQTGLVEPVSGKYFDIAIVVTQGPVRFLFHSRPEIADVVTAPQSVVDVCRLITA